MEISKKRRRKAYITSSNPNKRRRSEATLVAGMRGFICTCNGNEKGCIREALNILDEYVHKTEDTPVDSTVPEKEDENIEGSDDDIEKQLKQEIKDEKSSDKKLRVVNTGANNCIFISAKINNVLEVGEKIMNGAKGANLAKSRFLIRLVPVEVTCKAYNDDIKKAAERIFDIHFKCPPTTFSIHINKRSNNNLLRMEVTDDLARLVRDKNISHKVDLKNPSKTVVVEIIRNICCLSVISNFFELRKYNLIELGKNLSEDVKDESPDKSHEEVQEDLEEKNELKNSVSDNNSEIS